MKTLSDHTIETPMGFIPKGLSTDEPAPVPELPEDFEEFDNFRDMMLLYSCAIRGVNTKLENLDAELEMTGERNPIQYITHRVKTPASIMKKMKRKGIPLTFQNVWENLNDVAGVRVVCSYLEETERLPQPASGHRDSGLSVRTEAHGPRRDPDPHDRDGLLGEPRASAAV